MRWELPSKTDDDSFGFGAYTLSFLGDQQQSRDTPGSFPATEAAHGLNLVAPIVSVARNRTADEWSQIDVYLDHCAAVGMHVMWPLSNIFGIADEAERWRVLRAEVLHVREHPAVRSN